MADAPRITMFFCTLGRKPPKLPTVKVAATHLDLWLALGWERVGTKAEGKTVELVWKQEGEPKRPSR